MRKFLIRLALFSVIVFSLVQVLGMEIEKKDYHSDYMAAMTDKHSRLDKITGPRMIFVGGSSTSFGVDSRKVEKAIGIPTANLALVGGLGLDFILNEVEAKIRAGDIVILSTEYYLPLNGNYELKTYTAKCADDASDYFTRNYIKDLTTVKFKQIKNNFDYLLKKNRPLPDSSTDFSTAFLHRNAFNEYGDMIGHIGKRRPPKMFYKDDRYTYYYYKDGIDRLNRFYEVAQKKNVRVFFVYHAYAASNYELNKDAVQKYHQDMVNNLKFPVICKPTDFVYNDSLFFDTTFHLDTAGRTMRTEKLIGMLRDLKAKGSF